MGYARTGRNHAALAGYQGAGIVAGQPGKRRTGANREAYRASRDDMAERVASRLDRGRAIDDLAVQIRGLMAELAQCRTPAERAAVEAKARPLVRERNMLMSWGLFASR